MNLVWNYEKISIGSVSTNRWDGPQMWTSGYGWKDNRVFQWEATALPGGWYIVITQSSGKTGEFQGSTFNLPLEIASAAKRLL